MANIYRITLNLGGDVLTQVKRVRAEFKYLENDVTRVTARMRGLATTARTVKGPLGVAGATSTSRAKSITGVATTSLAVRGFERDLLVARNRFKTYTKDFLSELGNVRNVFTYPARLLGASSSAVTRGGFASASLVNSALGNIPAFVATPILVNKIGEIISSGIGALIYQAGIRIINGRNFEEATSRQLQFASGRIRLGEEYDTTYQRAQQLAIDYGGTRAGILSSVSTLAGTKVGSRELSIEDATWFAKLATIYSLRSGKNLAVSSLNLSQILTTGSGIDIKEMIKGDPIFLSYLQSEIKRQNYAGDVYAFVRENPQGFVNAAQQYIRDVPIPDVAKIRNRIANAKENTQDLLITELEPFFNTIGDTAVNIQGVYQRVIQRINSTFIEDESKFAQIERNLETMTDFFEGILNFLVDFASITSDVFDVISNDPILNKFFRLGPLGGASAGYTLSRDESPLGDIKYKTPYGDIFLPSEYINAIESQGLMFDVDKLTESNYGLIQEIQGLNQNMQIVDSNSPSQYFPLSDAWFKALVTNRKIWQVVPNEDYVQTLTNFLRPYLSPTGGNEDDIMAPTGLDGSAVDDTASQLDGITNGKRALIINFNRELVSQEITINGETAPQDLADSTADILIPTLIQTFQSVTGVR